MPGRVLVLYGPSLNLLGRREPELYGHRTLEDLNRLLEAEARRLGLIVECIHSNHEGALIDALHGALEGADGVILNAGGYAHTSVALADAVRAIAPIPVIEVHLTNTASREPWRHPAVVGAACQRRIEGFGFDAYRLALQAIAWLLDDEA